MKALTLTDVSIAYGNEAVVRGVSLEVGDGELHALLGVSGSGKTTILRAVAGFERLCSGRIELHGAVADDGRRWLPPERRGVGVVFQDYALFPHLDVAGNLRFGRRDLDADGVCDLLASVDLDGCEARAVSDLSGGEQQRVALARALAQRPRLVLLDEPFSNLNRELRRRLRDTTVAALRGRGVAAVFVTHDAEEAFAVADRISVLHAGRLLQTGTPEELYLEPASLAVARSVGDAECLPAVVDGDVAECALGRVPLRGAGRGGTLVVRPERLRVVAAGEGAGARATIRERHWLGPFEELVLELPGGQRLRARCIPGTVPNSLRDVQVSVDGAAVCID